MKAVNLLDKYRNMSQEVKASTAYTVCSILQKGISLITLPIFSRLLSTEQMGQCTNYSSWVGILTILITLNLAYGSFQTAMIKFREKREEYTSSISFLFAVFGAVYLAIYLPFQNAWNRLFKLPTIVIVFMMVEIVFSGVTDCWLSKNRFELKYRPVIVLTLMKAVASPLFALLLVKLFEEKGYARVIGYAIINILFGIVIAASVLCRGKTLYARTFWKYAFAFNIPLVPYYVAQMIFNVSDRIMIDHICGEEATGIYGMAYTMAMVLNFVVNAINGSYGPWFLTRYEEGQGEKNRAVSLKLSAVIAVGLWMIILAAPEILWIFGEEYVAGKYVIAPVAISMLLLFYTQIFDRLLFYYEKKYYLVFGGVIPCIVNLVLNYLYIPKYGYVAAAYTTLLSYILFAMTNYFLSLHVLKENGVTQKIYDIRALTLLLLALCAASLIASVLYGYMIIRIMILLVVMIVAAMNRKALLKMIKMES